MMKYKQKNKLKEGKNMKNFEVIKKIKREINTIGKIIRENLRWIFFCVCLIVFLKIVENIFENEIHIFDSFVYHTIAIFISTPVTFVMKLVTGMGSAIWLIGICMIALLLPKNKQYGKYMTINLVIITVLNQILKNIFNRPRPEGFRLIQETGYSFPSGHSMISMAFYGFLIYIIYKKVKNPYLKWGSMTLLFTLIVAIGISRIYLGVHYASDVIGGFCFSIAYLSVYTHFVSTAIERT